MRNYWSMAVGFHWQLRFIVELSITHGVDKGSHWVSQGQTFLSNFFACDGTKPPDLVSANTPHTCTIGTLGTELSRECTHTQSTHSIYRAPTLTFITQYQVQRKPENPHEFLKANNTISLLLTTPTV